MIDIPSITCTNCRDTIDMPIGPGTKWCKCGRTYLTKTTQSVGWGGPGRPRVGER